MGCCVAGPSSLRLGYLCRPSSSFQPILHFLVPTTGLFLPDPLFDPGPAPLRRIRGVFLTLSVPVGDGIASEGRGFDPNRPFSFSLLTLGILNSPSIRKPSGSGGSGLLLLASLDRDRALVVQTTTPPAHMTSPMFQIHPIMLHPSCRPPASKTGIMMLLILNCLN